MKAVEIELPVGHTSLLGFDTNCPLTAAQAAKFFVSGFRFAMRYVPRVRRHDNDLSAEEVGLILESGMAVGAVQHVESESSWMPSFQKGQDFGGVAAEQAIACGLLLDTIVCCDLEGVAVGVPHSVVMDYCAEWHAQVLAAGFTPDLYVGWHCGLTPDELASLPFTQYWGAYNLNADQRPSGRGVSMQQHVMQAPHGCPDIDSDTIFPDKLGMMPILCIPDNWPT